ncbi:MAG: aminotransferase class III-fold pyridoxal phosphate-dependent enzyme [Xanthomonadales bacterium]|nr:aminotransferase class III-fold pyridoxal phosphate-dependent enzyme [Xanthomonadales bacterium]
MASLPQFPNDDEARVVELAEKYIAGGVVSLNRKVTPCRVFCRGLGSKIWDLQGREYIDYHAAFAPHILGHNFPRINDAVKKSLDDHWSLMGSGPTLWEVELAQMVCAAVASVDSIQITNTGSEAVSLAIRLSQAHTGREDIIVMLGGYNGWHSEVARSVMPGKDVIGPRIRAGQYPFLPASAGISLELQSHVHVVNFNDLESVEYILKKYPIACVLTEPALQNIGIVLPHEGYLAGLIDLCERYGALCVLDEVKTGFRTALGGYQSVAGVSPHLSIFGKAIANGYPLGVIGGRRDIMDLFDSPLPEKKVLIAGTYNAHPIACAASIATLKILKDPEVYASIRGTSTRLYDGLKQLFAEAGIPAVLVNNESAFCVYFSDSGTPPRDWHDVLQHHDFELDLRYRKALIDKGIYHIPLACKQGSISYSHSNEDIDKTLQTTRKVLKHL